MKHIFVSHSTKDDKIVSRLVAGLSALGHSNLWVDLQKIEPTELWELSIEQALRDSYICIVMVSRNSVKSEEVRAEWRSALLYK